jgi:hypothetical protein
MTDVEQSLEDFRMWLTEEINFPITNEPITTCLTIAVGRIERLKEMLAQREALIVEYRTMFYGSEGI